LNRSPNKSRSSFADLEQNGFLFCNSVFFCFVFLFDKKIDRTVFTLKKRSSFRVIYVYNSRNFNLSKFHFRSPLFVFFENLLKVKTERQIYLPLLKKGKKNGVMNCYEEVGEEQ